MDSNDDSDSHAVPEDTPPPASTEAHITGLDGDLLQFPVRTASHIHQPSFRDNEFVPPGKEHDDTVQNPDTSKGSYATPPVIIVQGAQEASQQTGEKDNKGGRISASESDASDAAFSNSIQMVDDGGFSAWKPSSGDQPNEEDDTNSSSASNTEGTQASANDPQGAETSTREPSSNPHETLRGVGSSFSGTETHENASSDELAKRIDAENFVEAVGGKLHRALKDSAFNKREFLPLNRLCSILGEATIRKLLADVYPTWTEPRIDECVSKICGPDVPGTGRRRIFAVLVIIEKVKAIDDFIKCEVWDTHLPLDVEHKTNKSKGYYLCKKGDPDLPNPLPCCRGWQSKHMRAFKQNQAYMLASYLNLPGNETYYYKLLPESVLPFISRVHMKGGGFSQVSKVQIHKGHHNFPQTEEFPDAQPYFALKELHSHDPAYFKKEVEVLQRFSGRSKPNPYLIRLLLAFSYDNTHYLLFNWADGNLKQYWASEPNPQVTHERSCLVMQQCLSIALGLRRIHHVTSDSWPPKKDGSSANKSGLKESDAQKGKGKEDKDWGRHGDIKPENILWFRSKGKNRLLISDFGLSRYHSYLSKSRNDSEDLDGFSPTYRPPDIDMRKPITPRYDIWALGCVFLEYLSWYLLGHDLTERNFTNERLRDDEHMAPGIFEDKFFNLVGENGQRQPVVKQSVKMWIQRLHAHERCPKFVHAFLDVIEDNLMVVDSNSRWDCEDVVRELSVIRGLCESSEEYSAKGEPRGARPTEFAIPKDEPNEKDQGIDVLELLRPKILPGKLKTTVSSGRKIQHGQSRDEYLEQPEQADSGTDEDDAKSQQEIQEVTAAYIKSDTSMLAMNREDESEAGDPEDNDATKQRGSQSSGENTRIPRLLAQSTLMTSQESGEPGPSYSANTTPLATPMVSLGRLPTLQEPAGQEDKVRAPEDYPQEIGETQSASSSKGVQTEPKAPMQKEFSAPTIVVASPATVAHASDSAVVDGSSGVENPADLAPSSHHSTQVRGTSDLSVGPFKTSHDDTADPLAGHSSSMAPLGGTPQPKVKTGSRGRLRKFWQSLKQVWGAATHCCTGESE
ncbi:kinase-like protein [Thozetella sp. PMI_491]|nr:kinase-like protein [Thozetella sp. PMI_491]